MADKVNNLQDIFLNHMRKTKTPVTMFLVKGVKLQGIITWFDNFSVLLRRDGHAQLIYKHAISTVMPSHAIDLSDLEHAADDAVPSPLGLVRDGRPTPFLGWVDVREREDEAVGESVVDASFLPSPRRVVHG